MINIPVIKKSIPLLIALTGAGFGANPAYAAAPFTPASQPIGYIAQPALSTLNIGLAGGYIYRGEYDKGNWSGNLSCYPIDNMGNVDTNTPCWSVTGAGTAASTTVGAQSQVDAMLLSNRYIGTLYDSAAKRIPFQWTSVSTSAAYKAALLAAANVDFIRGDRTQESPTGALRTRTSRLGDTIHSRPAYVTEVNGANPTVIYGGNDGMLHAIDASPVGGGGERWAYIPSMLIPKLSSLWAGGYAHEYYVDGNIATGTIGSGTATTNIVVGALGAGGKGIYALNINSLTATSDQNAADKILWEITPTTVTNTSVIKSTCVAGVAAPTGSYCNLGDAYSNPVIGKLTTGQDAVIIGNGYNNTGNGHATLYIINAQDGTLIKEIDTGVGVPITSPNGLSTPVKLDSNGDGFIDAVYAGDINGNMWKFDLSSASPGSWSAQKLYATGLSITSAPDVSVHPSGGYMVNFATGRMLNAADETDKTTVNYAYGIWDNAPGSNTSIVTQTITERNYIPVAGATTTFRTRNATANAPNWGIGGDMGWRAALPTSNGVGGERVVGDNAFILFRKFTFNAVNPNVQYTPSGLATNSGLGENWLMELNYLTGGSPNVPPKDANVPFFDMDGDGLFTDGDRIKYTSGVDTLPNTNPPTTFGMPITSSLGLPVGYITANGVQSQPMIAAVGNYTVTLYNQNPDVMTAPTVPPNAVGVGNGHFDVDLFYNFGTLTKPKYQENSHVHEYDKIYDVNGWNFLNPNDSKLKMSLAGITATTKYKVLLMNQAWNRAMLLKVGTRVWSTKDYQTGTPNASGLYNPLVSLTGTGLGALNMASLTTYTGNASTVLTTKTDPVTGKVTVLTTSVVGSIGCGGDAVLGCTTTTTTSGNRDEIGGFELSMPYDAFSIKDWWSDKVKQTGVMPTAPACPDGSDSATGKEPTNSGTKMYTGPLGERNDGVITVQVVKDTTPDNHVQLNVPGRPDLGFRVIDAQILNDVLAEFIIYWHHPMNVCMGDTTSTWKTTNNSGDPWWPNQVTNGGGKNGGWNWNTPAPTPGWTSLPPPDLATTAMPTPKYSTTLDDPRTASFVKACGGAGQPACSACGATGQPACSTCGGTGQPACSACGGPGQAACPPPGTLTNGLGGGAQLIGANCGKAGQAACVRKLLCGGTGQPACTVAGGCSGPGQPICQPCVGAACNGTGGAGAGGAGGTGQCASCGGAGQPNCLPAGTGQLCCDGAGEPSCSQPQTCAPNTTCRGLPPTNRTKRLSWHEIINQ